MKLRYVGILVGILIAAANACGQAAPSRIEGDFISDGYAIRWHYRSGKLVYMKQLKDGYYDLFTMKADGTDQQPLTVDHPLLPNKHQGAPNWHPSGKYVVFVAEKRKHEGGSYAAIPGFGGYSDIWLISAEHPEHAWQLTDEPNDYDHGILLPAFSPDGKKLTWAERVGRPQLLDRLKSAGNYVIHVADFSELPAPHLQNIQTIHPGGEGFYEVSTFSPDGKSLYLTSNFETKNFWNNQIYRYDLASGRSARLTQDGYNEHPSFTPDGKRVIYMSARETDGIGSMHGTDWWMMDPDGAHQQRISFMNKLGDPECSGKAVWAGTVAWSPDGKWFYGDVQTNLLTQAGKVIRVTLSAE